MLNLIIFISKFCQNSSGGTSARILTNLNARAYPAKKQVFRPASDTNPVYFTAAASYPSVPKRPIRPRDCTPRKTKETQATANKNSKKKASKDVAKNERAIANNRKARHHYLILDTLECGIVLTGSEVKSLRNGQISLEEAYGRVLKDEVWLVGCDIQEYNFAHQLNHAPKRPRKLLMHRREILKFAAQAYEKNLTLVPLKMYFVRGRAKVLMGIGRGKKLYDKRESLKKKDMQRDMDRATRRG